MSSKANVDQMSFPQLLLLVAVLTVAIYFCFKALPGAVDQALNAPSVPGVNKAEVVKNLGYRVPR